MGKRIGITRNLDALTDANLANKCSRNQLACGAVTFQELLSDQFPELADRSRCYLRRSLFDLLAQGFKLLIQPVDSQSAVP